MRKLFLIIKIFITHLFSTNPKRTYWQKTNTVVGPALKENFDKTGQKETRNAIEKFILDHSDKETKLLDAGCNTGIEGYRLITKGYKGKYFGADSNNKAIEYAKYNLSSFKNIFLTASDLDKLDFASKYFDIVLIKDIIEHQIHYKTILSKLNKLTNNYLILSLFIKLTPKNQDEIKLHPDGYYLNKYSKNKLLVFFAQQGFKKPKIIYSDKQDEVLIFKRI